MIVLPKIRGFICTTAHPEGCKENVNQQIEYVKGKLPIKGPKKVLAIGSSTGYGLATRIVSAFGCGASTIGVSFERAATNNRTATPGWYNTAAFEEAAARNGIYAKSLFGDAFSQKVKDETINLIRQDLGKVDMVVYSLAAPKRHLDNGEVYSSVLKPVGKTFSDKTIDLNSNRVSTVSIEPASQEEIEGTVKVMGGEDWLLWIQALKNAGVLSQGVRTLAYSYIGPEVTYPVYREGTVGIAKKDLERTAMVIRDLLSNMSGSAYVSVNKAVVTQASAAIPVVPLYVSILFKIMKDRGIHEGCIEQMYRLFQDKLSADKPALDECGRIRMDDWELREDVQQQVTNAWNIIDNDNLGMLSDVGGYRDDFQKLFGFGQSGVDYDKEVDIHIEIPGLTIV